MAVQSFLAYAAGKLARILPLQASAGAVSAGAVVALNTSGFVDQTMIGPHGAPAFTVANLPKTGNVVGQLAYATNGRALMGVSALGVGGLLFQTAGAGTGCLVTWSGSAWQVAGTATTVAA